MMNKLGFKIKVVSQGAGDVIECNKGQWTNKVVDIREYLKMFNGLNGTKNTITFISFDESGCYITLLRAISGRDGDHLSGWIYIPNNVEISDSDVNEICNFVKKVLSQSNLNEYKEEIEYIFSKTYQCKEKPVPYNPTSGELYGVRYIGHYTLEEILGSDRYQPYYSNYKAIFLLEKNGEVSISPEYKNKFKDLTNEPIETLCVLQAPTAESLKHYGKGVKIVFQDGKEFKSPISVKKDEQVYLIAKREGFEPQKLKITVTDKLQTFPVPKASIKWEKRISASTFDICDEDSGEKINNARISVNQREISPMGNLFSETDLCNANVVVKANGYDDYKTSLNLSIGLSYKITLTRSVKNENYQITLANGKMADMALNSKYLSSFKGECPIKGYTFDFDESHNKRKPVLRPSVWYVWKQRFIGFFVAIIIGLLIGLYCAISAWVDTHEFRFGIPPWKEKTENVVDNGDQSSDDGTYSQIRPETLDYLNNNTQWSQDRLSQDPATQNLYKMINEYNFAELAVIDITGCEKLDEIKKLADEMCNKGLSIKGPYSSDGTITIQQWIDKVNAKSQENMNFGDTPTTDTQPENNAQKAGETPAREEHREKNHNTNAKSEVKSQDRSAKSKDLNGGF